MRDADRKSDCSKEALAKLLRTLSHSVSLPQNNDDIPLLEHLIRKLDLLGICYTKTCNMFIIFSLIKLL